MAPSSSARCCRVERRGPSSRRFERWPVRTEARRPPRASSGSPAAPLPAGAVAPHERVQHAQHLVERCGLGRGCRGGGGEASVGEQPAQDLVPERLVAVRHGVLEAVGRHELREVERLDHHVRGSRRGELLPQRALRVPPAVARQVLEQRLDLERLDPLAEPQQARPGLVQGARELLHRHRADALVGADQRVAGDPERELAHRGEQRGEHAVRPGDGLRTRRVPRLVQHQALPTERELAQKGIEGGRPGQHRDRPRFYRRPERL